MAEGESDAEKTEEPTPQRLQKAREQGQILSSNEMFVFGGIATGTGLTVMLFALMPQIETVLAIGGYAHAYHFTRLGRPYAKGARVDETVRRWKEFHTGRPRLFPLPHPSWRNSGWLKRNPWFEAELLPDLRAEVARLVQPDKTFSAA